MARYNINGDVLALGTNTWVRVDLEDENGGNVKEVGFVQNWNIRKNLQTQEAKVIGELQPVSIDIMGVSVDINMSGFIPTKEVMEAKDKPAGSGEFTLKHFNPNVDNLLDNLVVTKIAYLDFYDKKHKAILSSAKWLTPVSYSDSGNASDYVKADCSFKAIYSDNGSFDTAI